MSSDEDDGTGDHFLALLGVELELETDDISNDVNNLLTIAGEQAWIRAPENRKEACQHALSQLMAATVALAKSSGMTEEEAGEAFVEAWANFDSETGELN